MPPAPPLTDTIDLSEQKPLVAAAPAVAQSSIAASRCASPRDLVWAQAAVVVLAISVAAPLATSCCEATTTQAANEPAPVSRDLPLRSPMQRRPFCYCAAGRGRRAETPFREEAPPAVAVRPPAVEPAPAIARCAVRRAEPRIAPLPPPLPPGRADRRGSSRSLPIEAARAGRAANRAARDEFKIPILVFETRALVGTRKSKEQGAQLLMGDGKITIIPTNDPASPLCSFPYGRVLAINVSRGRDPLWARRRGRRPWLVRAVR